MDILFINDIDQDIIKIIIINTYLQTWHEKCKNKKNWPTQKCHVSNGVLGKDFHFGFIGSFYCVCTLWELKIIMF
jgi:hypothetical protein